MILERQECTLGNKCGLGPYPTDKGRPRGDESGRAEHGGKKRARELGEDPKSAYALICGQ